MSAVEMGSAGWLRFCPMLSMAILLPLQLWLCFTVRSRAIRLLPVLLLSIPTILYLVSSIGTSGWENLRTAFLLVWTVGMLLMCGMGWGIWWMMTRRKRKGPRSR